MSANKSSKSRKVGKQDPLRTAMLGQVLAELGIYDWDVLIVGDGSGTSWDRGAGWSAVLVDHYLGRRKLFYGGMNAGTVTIGEVLPYVHAMSWYSRGVGKERLHARRTDGSGRNYLHVHIITDSALVASQGNDPQEQVVRRKANREWWAALDSIIAMGYQMHWHWMARDRLGLNMLTDHLSRTSRQAIEAISLPEGVDVYDLNPGPGEPGQAPQITPQLAEGEVQG